MSPCIPTHERVPPKFGHGVLLSSSVTIVSRSRTGSASLTPFLCIHVTINGLFDAIRFCVLVDGRRDLSSVAKAIALFTCG